MKWELKRFMKKLDEEAARKAPKPLVPEMKRHLVQPCPECKGRVLKSDLGAGFAYFETVGRGWTIEGPHSCKADSGGSVFAISAGAVDSNRRRH
jgi:hypothetical protein